MDKENELLEASQYCLQCTDCACFTHNRGGQHRQVVQPVRSQSPRKYGVYAGRPLAPFSLPWRRLCPTRNTRQKVASTVSDDRHFRTAGTRVPSVL